MLMMTTITPRQMKRSHVDNDLTYPISKHLRQQLISRAWSVRNTKKFKRNDQEEEEQAQYHCQVFFEIISINIKMLIRCCCCQVKQEIAR